MSLRVAWKWGLCAPGLTILWSSLMCLGCGLLVSVVLRAPGANQQNRGRRVGPGPVSLPRVEGCVCLFSGGLPGHSGGHLPPR